MMAKITVRARDIGNAPFFGTDYFHTYIVVEYDNGTRVAFQAFPSGGGDGNFSTVLNDTNTSYGTLDGREVPYALDPSGHPYPGADFDPTGTNHPSVTVWNGSDAGLSPIVDAMRQEMAAINAMDVPYNGLYRNSNSFVGELLDAAELPQTLPRDATHNSVWAPAFDNNLRDGGDYDIRDILSDYIGNKLDRGGEDIRDTLDGIGNTMRQLFQELGQEFNGLLHQALDKIDIRDHLWNAVDDLIDRLRDLFDKAEDTRSPLVLDLDGDGVETRSISDGVHFDHDGNGFVESTGWAGADDGLLVLDRNGNGQIDGGAELFGNRTMAGAVLAENGFAALAALDSNRDGVVDALDARFGELRVWRDADASGTVGTGEMLTLAQAGVQSLNLAYADGSDTDAAGNQHLQVGSYTATGGAIRAMTDVWFAVDTARTETRDSVPVSAAIEALPDLAGFGNVYSLHQAMARDASGVLQGLVEDYLAEVDGSLRHALLIDIIYRWAGVQDIAPDSRAATQIYGNVIGDARKLATLEAFLGEGYVGIWCWGELDANPHGPAAAVLLQAFDLLADQVAGQLDAAGSMAALLDLVRLTWDDATGLVAFDTNALADSLQALYDTDPEAAVRRIADLRGVLLDAGPTGVGVLLSLQAEGEARTGDLAVFLAGITESSTLGTSDADVLYGDGNANLLLGQAGNDGLYGGGGDDTLSGDSGDDHMEGGDGADIYHYARHGGSDVINNMDGDAPGTAPDVLELGEGIAVSDVRIVRDYYDLLLVIGDAGDQIRVYSYLDQAGTTGAAIDIIRFADGTEWTPADIVARLNRPTSGDDLITLGDGNDTVNALAGNDQIEGNGGNDRLSGAAGDDWIYGGDGNDVLDGAAGNDYLYGGAGRDIYRFGLGDGDGTIYNTDWNRGDTGDTDMILVDADIAPADLAVRRYGDDLLLEHVNGTDRMRVVSHFAGLDHQISEVRFADGTIWSAAMLLELSRTGSPGDDVLIGGADGDTLSGLGGNDMISGMEGDDLLRGGTGGDTLYGDAGNDTLDGGGSGPMTEDGWLWQDWLTGGDGADTYRVSGRWGQLVIDNHDWTPEGEANPADRIVFGAGIGPDDITVRRSGMDLVLTRANGDVLTVQNHFYGDYYGISYQIDHVVFADGTDWTTADLLALSQAATEGNDTLYGTDGRDTLAGLGGNDQIDGGGGRDFISGNAGDDLLYGGDGNDVIEGDAGADVLAGDEGDDNLRGGADDDQLYGGNGNDTLIGGTGNDYLVGSEGADTYSFAPGWGMDIIESSDSGGDENQDAITFAAGILPGQISVRRVGWDLVLSHENGLDRVTVSSHFYGPGYQIEAVRFVGGTVWTAAQLHAMSLVATPGDDELQGADGSEAISGGLGNDTLFGWGGNDALRGEAGDDQAYGGTGNDTLYGGAGNDTLGGDEGDDTLNGGAGDDWLGGGGANNLYVFDAGWGNDHIDNSNAPYEPGDRDVVRFGAGISADDIFVRFDGTDLFLLHANGTDSIQVHYHVYSDQYALTRVEFADGTVWTAEDLAELSQSQSGNFAPTGLPLVVGDAIQGNQIYVDLSGVDDRDGLPGVFTYQWFADGDEIDGQTDSWLGLESFLVGREITVRVGYTDLWGNEEELLSLATPPVQNINDPVGGEVLLTGTLVQGERLTIDTSLISDEDGLGTFSYRWFLDGAVMAGLTGPSILLPAIAAGGTIFAEVSFLDGGGTVETIYSDYYGPVGNVNDAPGGNVRILGTATEGQWLEANTANIFDADGFSGISTYQWFAGGVALADGTGNTLFLDDSVVGKAITLRVTYTDDWGTQETLTSAATAAVRNVNDVPTGEVVIQGEAVQGALLTADLSSVADEDGLGAFAYQWFANGTAIAGATAASLRLTQAEVGDTITLRLRYTDGHGRLETLTSWGTSPVANVNDLPTGTVSITGTARQGAVLTAVVAGLADPDGLGPLQVQWLADGAEIPGATASTLTLTAAHVGAEISVRISYVDGDSTLESLTSAETAAVIPALLEGGADGDTLTGSPGDDQIFGLGGNDRLVGYGGNDSLYGGDGNDTLNGGAGDDFLYGGPDDADLRDVIYGGEGHDFINGGAGQDELNGGTGRDTILGGLGADTLIGNEDNDVLSGMGGADVLFGNDGDDYLNGGFGYDRLNGGTGADIFFHQGIADHGSDWVQDYSSAEGDVLQIGITGLTRADFVVNYAFTIGPGGVHAGSSAVREAFVNLRSTGQTLWALVDGEGQDSLMVRSGGATFDLLA